MTGRNNTRRAVPSSRARQRVWRGRVHEATQWQHAWRWDWKASVEELDSERADFDIVVPAELDQDSWIRAWCPHWD
jgi:hypothetical protein